MGSGIGCAVCPFAVGSTYLMWIVREAERCLWNANASEIYIMMRSCIGKINRGASRIKIVTLNNTVCSQFHTGLMEMAGTVKVARNGGKYYLTPSLQLLTQNDSSILLWASGAIHYSNASEEAIVTSSRCSRNSAFLIIAL